MKLKTAKGNIKILAEGQGGLLFQKQVAGEHWQQNIVDDNVLGGYYYNYAKADFMPDELGEDSPWYRAMIQNTNNTVRGLRIVPYDRNTIYINASAGSVYHHVKKGLSKIAISSSTTVDADYAVEAGHAIEAIYAEVAGGAPVLGDINGDDESAVVYGYNIGNSKQPVYFSEGEPVACGTALGSFNQLIYMDANGFQAGSIVKSTKQRDLDLSDAGTLWFTFGYAKTASFWVQDNITKHGWSGKNIILYNLSNQAVYNDEFKLRLASQRIGSRVEANIEMILNTATALDDYAIELTTQWFRDVVTNAEASNIKITHCIAVPRKGNRDGGSPTLFTHVGDNGSRKKAWVVIDSSGDNNKFAGCYITLIGEVN